MTLKEALQSISTMDGWFTFKPSQVYSMLGDLGVFQSNPRIRLVLKRALQYNYWDIFIEGIFSESEISKLKNRLLYDGFSEDVVTESLSSFRIEERPIKTDTVEQAVSTREEDTSNCTNKTQATQSKPVFMGIALGESVDKFSQLLLGRGFKKSGVTMRFNRDVLSFIGPFANLKDAYVYIEYSADSNVVYGVVISFLHRDLKDFYKIVELYEGKYGRLITTKTASKRGKYIDSLVTKIAKLSDDGRIEISFSLIASKITIAYISDSLWAIEEPKVLNRIQEKTAKANAEKKAKIDQTYQDI